MLATQLFSIRCAFIAVGLSLATASILAGGAGHASFQTQRRVAQTPPWGVGYGQEFWRSSKTAKGNGRNPSISTATAAGRDAFIDFSELIERITYALQTNDDSPQVQSPTYTARFEGQSLCFAPHRLESGASRSRPDRATEAKVGTVAISRGSRFFDGSSPREWFFLGNTAQALVNRDLGLVEHYEMRAEGVNLTWILAKPAPGSGPLIIEFAIAGLSFDRATANGLHFMDATGTSHLCLGPVRVVAANGLGWPVAPTVSGNLVRIEVPHNLLTEAEYPLAVDPLISPEFGMNDEPLVIPSVGVQGLPAVAASRDQFLVVWEDVRAGSPDVFGARVDADGTVLDARSFGICTLPSRQNSPAVAGNASGYLVVWEDTRNGRSDIYGARVNTNGTVLDGGGIVISQAPSTVSARYEPKVAACGDDYLVVWWDMRNSSDANWNPDIYGARVTARGVVVEPDGIPICRAARPQVSPEVAGNDTGYLVVWRDGRFDFDNSDIFGARVSRMGTVLDSEGFAITTAPRMQNYPAVAANSESFLVAWEDRRNATNVPAYADIYGARINLNGTVLDADGLAISSATNEQTAPAVSADGLDYLVAWSDSRNEQFFLSHSDIYGTRVTAAGILTEPDGLLMGSDSSVRKKPALAVNGTDCLAVWQGFRIAKAEIYGTVVNTLGSVANTNGTEISHSANNQTLPAVACNGSEYLVVWSDDRSLGTGADIFGVRIAPTGTVHDPNGITISTAVNSQSYPAVAALGLDFLVVWEDARNSAHSFGPDIFGARVREDGTVLDPAGIAICTDSAPQYDPVLAANGTNYLVVWTDTRRFNEADIYGARVSRDGAVSELAGIPIATQTGWESVPAIASSQGEYLVVWQHNSPPPFGIADIRGARVSSAGEVLSPSPLVMSTLPSFEVDPSIAGASDGYLVVWEDGRGASNANPSDIYGTRVSAMGMVLDPIGFPITTATNRQAMPVVTFTGSDFLVAWQDDRNAVAMGADIYGARVDRNSTVLDPPGLPINTGPYPQRNPSVASDGAGQCLVVNSSFREAPFWSLRVLGNFVSSASAPPLIRTVAIVPGGFKLTWTACAGRSYFIQVKTNLSAAPWSDLSPVVVAEDGLANYIDPLTSAGPQRFYRVVQLP